MLITLLGVGLLSGGAVCLAALAVCRYAPDRLSVVFGGLPEADLDDWGDLTPRDVDPGAVDDDADLDDEYGPEDYDEIEGEIVQDGEYIEPIDIDFGCDVDDGWAEADW